MEFRDNKIYKMLANEFFLFINKNGNISGSDLHFNEFIEMKDLGIICLSYFGDLYKIVDKKKWALTKIKYGI